MIVQVCLVLRDLWAGLVVLVNKDLPVVRVLLAHLDSQVILAGLACQVLSV